MADPPQLRGEAVFTLKNKKEEMNPASLLLLSPGHNLKALSEFPVGQIWRTKAGLGPLGRFETSL